MKATKKRKTTNKRRTRKSAVGTLNRRKVQYETLSLKENKKIIDQLAKPEKGIYEQQEIREMLGGPRKIQEKDVTGILNRRIFQIFKLLDQQNVAFQPSKDFYTYANTIWLNAAKKNPQNEYFVQIDNFRIVQNKVYLELMEFVKDEPKTTKFGKCLHAMYQSWLRLKEAPLRAHMRETVAAIEGAATLWDLLAYMSKNEIVRHSCPLGWNLQVDAKNSKIYANYILPPEFGLFDINVYFMFKKSHAEVKAKYVRYINRVFDAVFGKNHPYKGEHVFVCEQRIAFAFDCGIREKENDEMYYKFTSKKAIDEYQFDWNAYAHALGYKHVPDHFIATDLNYLKCMTKELLANWQSKEWRTYFVFVHINQMIRFGGKLREIYYEYNERDLGGQQVIFPREIYPVFGLAIAFNTFLTKKYVAANFRQQYVTYVEHMSNNLREIFVNRIKQNRVFSEKTRNYAIYKLRKIKFEIAAPKVLREDPLLDYDANDVWGNMMKIGDWRHRQNLELSGKGIRDIPEVDWKTFKLNGQPYVVNAFYKLPRNAIYIPLAYLQKPFIDLDENNSLGIEYNLAFLGFTLAHELSHSLDSSGRLYDANGNRRNWWNISDIKKYNNIVRDVNKQYDTAMKRDGIKDVDTSMYLAENLADNVGFYLCCMYLMLFRAVHNENDGIALTFLSFKLFFNYYAIQMRQHINKNAYDIQLKMNPHAMDRYRANCVLSRNELFKKIYKIKEGDPMYWHSNDVIW